MLHVNQNASIVGLALLASGFLWTSANTAEAQLPPVLPTAPYQVIDLYPMSAGSTNLAPFNEGPGGFGSAHYLQLAAGGQFLANQSRFFPQSGTNAYLWNGSSSPVPLNPTGTGSTSAYVAGTDGIQQIGAATSGIYNTASHATLWSGTAASAVDLNPSQLGATASFGLGVKNGQQVGYSVLNGSGVEVATLWNGSASSAVLLTSSAYYTEAIATDGVHQVGWVGSGSTIDGGQHAVMWTGTAASMVSLHPAGYGLSEALTLAKGQEGGYATTVQGADLQVHPGIWTGSAASFVDLTPPAFAADLNASGIVMSTNGVQQVGYFGINGSVNAYSPGAPMIWSGTADSAEVLPTFGNDYFTPFDIDDAGNIYGIAYDPTTGAPTAVEWVPTPTPEPGSLALLGFGGVGLLLRRRKRA